MIKTRKKKLKRRDPIASDLRTPKYKMRVVQDKRKKDIKHKRAERGEGI